MSDNELTISDYYEAYPIMRYILPGLVYNNGAAPQKNISNNAFILRQGAWILSKILDDEHTVYGYETFHPAQRYVLGDTSRNMSIDQNKFNIMMIKLEIIRSRIRGIGGTMQVNLSGFHGGPRAPITLPDIETGGIRINQLYSDSGTRIDDTTIRVCGLSTAQLLQRNEIAAIRNMLARYMNTCQNIIFENIMFDNNLAIYALDSIYYYTDSLEINHPFHMDEPANPGQYDQTQIDVLINRLRNSVPIFYERMGIKFMSNLYDLPFYIIYSLIISIIESAGVLNNDPANHNAPYENFTGNVIINIIEDVILSDAFMSYVVSLVYSNTLYNINSRKNNFFHHLTDATQLNTAIGLHVPLGTPAGSFIVPYTDYEERSESNGGHTIDNRDLLDGIRAGAEPKISQVGDRIRNGKKGDHIATVLTSDDVRLLAIFLQLAVDNFNAPAAKSLYNSRNDINYNDHTRTKGLRNPGTIGSYFDHLVALRETDNDVRKGSGLNQGKVEALSVLAGLKYAIQGPIFPVLSQTVFHLVAHYFVRLVVHDSRAPNVAPPGARPGPRPMKFINISDYMKFINGNGKRLQLLQTLNDQVSMTIIPAIFGCPGTFHLQQYSPFDVPLQPGQYDHDTQVITFIQLIQNFMGPGSATPATTSTTYENTGPRGYVNSAGANNNFFHTYDIMKKVYDDIRTFVTGSQFIYTDLENHYLGGRLNMYEPVFHGFAGTLAFHGHQELSSINVSTIEPTLFDTDIRHLLKFNVADRAIKVLGNEIHIMGTSTQNSFTGALVAPKQKFGSGGQFIVNDYGMLEYQEIINGQVVQTDNAQLYNKIIGNNDYCKVFGSARFNDPTRDKGSVCNTMISACSIIGNYGNPAKCAAAFREIQDDHVSKNLRGWNSFNKNISQLSAYKILTGMGLDSVTNKDGDFTFKDDNNDYIFDDQQIFDKLELSRGVAVPPGGVPTVITPSTSNHVKYIKKLMDIVDIIKITKNVQKKDNLPTLKLPFFPAMRKIAVKAIQVGIHAHQRGGDNQDEPLKIMYGGTSCDLQIIRKNIQSMKDEAKKRGLVFQRKDELKLDKIMNNLGQHHDELRDIEIYYKASLALKDQNGRNPLKSELEKKIVELKKSIDKGYKKIDLVKKAITNAFLIVS
jgi:hypothetical protein